MRTTSDLEASGWTKNPDGSYSKGKKVLTPSVLARLDSPEKRLRQSSKPEMNKLESDYYTQVLLAFYKVEEVLVHDITFRLGNGVRYTPDFAVFDGQKPACYELKGPMAWDDSIVKLKVAASKYKMFRWVLVWRDEAKAWKTQEILP